MFVSSATDQREDEQSAKRSKKVRVILFPIFIRLIIIPVLLFISLTVGMMIGYGVIGDGNPLDVFKKSTWQHIVNFVTEQ